MAPVDPNQRGFFSRNLVAIVMVPGLVLMHWYWLKLQDNKFIPEELRGKSKLPTTLLYEEILKKIQGLKTSSSDEPKEN